ncbi:DUF1707 domain-containing protein [Rhodococcus sp. NPDC058532]|uniref:DUF1707 domain-containing protein n=1 Tax=Rhodococcus sp. NPDC058532 TaxID=3346540 RepID=UPI00366A0E11
MAEPPDIRIGTAEREQALDQLSQHFSAGRLTVTEFDERSGLIAVSSTRGELDRLLADLPALSPQTSVPAAAESGPVAASPRPDWAGRIVALVPLIALVLFFVTGTWVWFLAVPAAGILLLGTDRERKRRRGVEGNDH